MKIASAYIRVSTDDQTEYSPDAQLREIKKYAAANNLLLDNRFVYMEDGISGRSAKKRPLFNEMISVAKQTPPPFQVILLWKFSRFARNQEESIVYKAMLRKSGVEVISVSEPLVDGPFGSLIERIIEWMDEYYSIRLSGEVTRGMTEKARRGGFQSAPSFGYEKKVGSPLSIIPQEAEIVRFIFDQYDAGFSFFSIARKLNAMGVKTKRGNPFENRTVEYMICNPIYVGDVRWTPTKKTVGNRDFYNADTLIVHNDTIPPIITREQFDRVNEKARAERERRRRKSRPAETKKHWLSGILRCAECGGSMTYASSTAGFQCVNYGKGRCPSHYISQVKIEKAIFDALNELCINGNFIPCIRKSQVEEDPLLDILRQELHSNEKMLERAKSAFLSGLDTEEEYGENKRRIQSEIKKLSCKISAFEKELQDAKKEPDSQESIDKIRSISSLLSSEISTEKKAAALAETFEKITFSRPSNQLYFYIYE